MGQQCHNCVGFEAAAQLDVRACWRRFSPRWGSAAKLFAQPLADSIVGISSTAALGAVISIASGFHAFGALSTPVLAFVGGLAGGIVLASAAYKIRNTNNLILVGVGISSISGALTSLILSLSDNPFAINEIVFWMLGSLTDVSLFQTATVTPFVILGGALLLSCRRDLNLLSLGGNTAATIGVVMNSLKTVLSSAPLLPSVLLLQ